MLTQQEVSELKSLFPNEVDFEIALHLKTLNKRQDLSMIVLLDSV